jgi:pimeloyl-ACP methyl ester carboxylesterase
MLHGNPVWSFVYREAVTHLRGRFRCIVLDFPGFGPFKSHTSRWACASRATPPAT